MSFLTTSYAESDREKIHGEYRRFMPRSAAGKSLDTHIFYLPVSSPLLPFLIVLLGDLYDAFEPLLELIEESRGTEEGKVDLDS